jgi:hypothetical protein
MTSLLTIVTIVTINCSTHTYVCVVTHSDYVCRVYVACAARCKYIWMWDETLGDVYISKTAQYSTVNIYDS